MADTLERSQRNELRKNQIIEAAVSVLKEKGVAASSMNDFIKASGLSKGGVYHHFSSKEELLTGVLNFFFEQLVSGMDNATIDPEASAYEKMRHLLTEHKQVLERVGELNQLKLDFIGHVSTIQAIREQFHIQYCHFQNLIASIVDEGIARGEFKKSTNSQVIASGIMGVFDGVCTALVVVPDRVEFPSYAVESSLAMLEGIRQ